MTDRDSTQAAPGPGPGHKRLEPFVGTWRTEGEVLAGPSDTGARFRATDSYEWLAGGFFLIHRWDAQMPDGDAKGIEIIGYEDASGTYSMNSFDSQGHVGVMQARADGDTWTFWSDAVRFEGGFKSQGAIFSGLWERRSENEGRWLPWMKVELTRTA